MPPTAGQTENVFTPSPCMSERGELTCVRPRVTKNGRKVLDRAGLRKHQSLRRTSAVAVSERNDWTKPQSLAILKQGHFQLEQGKYGSSNMYEQKPAYTSRLRPLASLRANI